MMHGVVVKNTGSWYVVLTDEGKSIDCKIKGNFRLKGIRSTNPVAVGDLVDIVPTQEGTAFITNIRERKNYVIRKAANLSKQSHILAANVDQACLVVTVNHPQTSTTFIDRFLASAEAYSIPVLLVFNKTDLLDEDERRLQQMMTDLYSQIGYKCVQLSALAPAHAGMLLPLLEGKTTLFSGNSGVGKSTLLNLLLPGVNLRTAEISDAVSLCPVPHTISRMDRDWLHVVLSSDTVKLRLDKSLLLWHTDVTLIDSDTDTKIILVCLLQTCVLSGHKH